MKIIDFYLFNHNIKPFGFFSLIFIGVLWLVQSLPKLDDIIYNGQQVDTFFYVMLLMLPQVMILVLPLAAFSATIFSTNKLFLDSEMIIIFGIGRSNIQIMKPILLFGILVTIFMYFLTLYVVPNSQNKLRTIMFDIQENITTKFIKGGQFLHPSSGVSIYVRESNKDGQLKGIFLSDTRNENRNITYSAKEALLIKNNNGMFILMKSGLIQVITKNQKQLVTIEFDQLDLNLNEFILNNKKRKFYPEETLPLKILTNFNDLENIYDTKKNEYIAEAHLKMVIPLTSLSLILLALTTFVSINYKKKNFSFPIYCSIAIGLVMQALTLSLKSLVAENSNMFWIIYLPVIIVFLSCFLILVPKKLFFLKVEKK